MRGFFFNKYIGNNFGDLQQLKKLKNEPHSLEISKKLRKGQVCYESIKYM